MLVGGQRGEPISRRDEATKQQLGSPFFRVQPLPTSPAASEARAGEDDGGISLWARPSTHRDAGPMCVVVVEKRLELKSGRTDCMARDGRGIRVVDGAQLRTLIALLESECSKLI